MTKQKSTKRALLSSAIALFVCVAMLIGTTFAWFTDSVTSKGNKIQAGTLKIDLQLYDTDAKAYKSIKDSKQAIFDYENWEPGYTDVKLLKVVNEGTLALKWMAKFVSDFELTKLAEVIDVYVKPSTAELSMPADRADLSGWTKAGTVKDFVNTIETTTVGTLEEKGEAAYLGIALKMREGAGNEYQGMSLGGAFDIQILATQYTYEKDSFNNQYDDVAFVSDAAALKDAIANGENVMLASDVDVAVDGKALTVPADADVLIDLNGNDIIATTDKSGASQILFEVKGELTIVGEGAVELHDKSGAAFNDAYENAAVYVNGGVANLNGGNIVCTSSGNAMAYAADAVGGNSVINVNGATLYSSYIGIRSFPTVSGKTNTVNYNSGVVYGAKNGYDIWTQNGNGSSVVNIADGIIYTYQDQWGGMYYIDGETTMVSTTEGLAAALTAGEDVVLATDVHYENTKLSIDSGKTATIDLNGNTLSGVNTASGTSALIENKGDLSIIGNGTITVLAENPDTDWDPEGFPTYASNTIANSGNLTIGEGVRIENQTAKGGASYAIDNYAGATLTVNGGEIIQSGGDVAIRMNTASATAENKVTINGGTISGKRAIWIHLAGSSNATAPKTTLTINGGNLSGTQMAIYAYSYGNSYANTSVTITGGTFNGDVQFGGGYKGDKETVSVTGGTFNGELGRWLANDGWEDIAKP